MVGEVTSIHPAWATLLAGDTPRGSRIAQSLRIYAISRARETFTGGVPFCQALRLPRGSHALTLTYAMTDHADFEFRSAQWGSGSPFAVLVLGEARVHCNEHEVAANERGRVTDPPPGSPEASDGRAFASQARAKRAQQIASRRLVERDCLLPREASDILRLHLTTARAESDWRAQSRTSRGLLGWGCAVQRLRGFVGGLSGRGVRDANACDHDGCHRSHGEQGGWYSLGHTAFIGRA
jgi:hypothetical protein